MTDDREALDRAIREVTDGWPEPLDSVHDIPPLRNAILAAGFRQAPTEVTDTLVDDVYALFVTAPGGMTGREAMRAALTAALGGTDESPRV